MYAATLIFDPSKFVVHHVSKVKVGTKYERNRTIRSRLIDDMAQSGSSSDFRGVLAHLCAHSGMRTAPEIGGLQKSEGTVRRPPPPRLRHWLSQELNGAFAGSHLATPPQVYVISIRYT